MWKNLLDKKTKETAFMLLIEENLNKENTKDIAFQSVNKSSLKNNKNKSSSQIFSVLDQEHKI